jgi:hypothetical protein
VHLLPEEENERTVVIKHNKYARHEACGICDMDRPLCIGPCLFLDGSWIGVCEECARESSPGLVAMLDSQEAQKAYWTAERDDSGKRYRVAREDKIDTLQAHLAFLNAQIAATETQLEKLKDETD